jgi:16S rRNA G966 N2-methylase RsmD
MDVFFSFVQKNSALQEIISLFAGSGEIGFRILWIREPLLLFR